jgi:hypothetical protein
MRLGGIILSGMLLSCLSISALASEPGDIAEPSINAPDMSMPAPIISAPNMDMPAPNPKPLVKPNNNPSPALNQVGNTSSNQAQEVEPMNLSGKWSIRLDNGTDGSFELNLWPSIGTNGIMGFGTFIEKGTANSVTAKGSVTSVTAQELSLIVKSATSEYINKKYDECDLDLLMVNNTLSGTYVLMSGGQSLSQGNAKAVKQ